MASQSMLFQRVWQLYEEEHGHEPATAREAAQWGHLNGLLSLPDIDPIDVLASRMARALREEYEVDEGGRRYRVNHAVKVTRGGVQYTFWGRMGFASREHMRASFALRREGIVRDCVQLRTDVDAYNGMNPSEAPVQLVLDFTEDVEENLAWAQGEGAAA